MQTSIVVSTPEARFSALALREDFRDSIRKVHELGFEAVELAIRDPGAIDVDEVQETLARYALPVPAIGTGQAYGEEGLSFTDPDPGIRDRAVDRIRSQMDLARELGGAQVIIGLIRGQLDKGQERDEAEGWFVECMRGCARYRGDTVLTVEAINRYETDLYNDLRSLHTIVETIDRPNVRVMLDTFHMNIEEADMCASIREVADAISHVHIADSNRWAPGCGHIDYDPIFSTLKEIGYDGALSAEILPEPNPEESARLTAAFFRAWEGRI